jgi:hypothetical protein
MFRDNFNLLRFQNKKSKIDTLKQEMFYNEDLNQRHANIAIQSSTSLASIDILEFLRRNNQSNFKMPIDPYISQSRKLLNSNSIVNSIFPAEDLLDGAGGVLEKLLGRKFWIFSMLIMIIFCLLLCICTYCFCCSKCGRSFLCCFICKRKSIS